MVHRDGGRDLFPSLAHSIESTVHQACAAWFHFSATVPLSSELLRARLRSCRFGHELTARVSALLAASPVRVHVREASITPLRSVLRLSQPLDGFLRALASRLVSSSSHVQGSFPFRGFSLTRSASALVGRRSPLAVGPPERSPSFSARRPPPKTSATRSRSAWSSVRIGSVMSLTDGRSPLRVGLLQVRSTSDEVTASP